MRNQNQKLKSRISRKILFPLLGILLLTGLFSFPEKTLAVTQCELNIQAVGQQFSEWFGDGKRTEDIFDCDQVATSFIEFRGGLAAPERERLAEGLTEFETAKDFILGVTNFVLGFLGIVAVVIVIYGGFLYVTARGNEEQATNGKKTITYAVIGIIIILASFAFVNTLIRLGATEEGEGPGTGAGGAAGAGGPAGAAGQQLQARAFHIAALEVRVGLQNFLVTYDRFVAIRDQLERVKSLPPPRDAREARDFLREVDIAFRQIMKNTEALSETRFAAKQFLQEFVEKWSRATDEELETLIATRLQGKKRLLAALQDIQQPGGPGGLPRGLPGGPGRRLPGAGAIRALGEEPEFLRDSCFAGQGVLCASFKQAFEASSIEKKNEKDFEAEIARTEKRLSVIQDGLGPPGDAFAQDYIQRGILSETELKKALAEIPPDLTVKEAFTQARDALRAARGLITDPNDPGLVRDTVQSLARLFLVVRDLKFMIVRITASATEGNAPLVVQFKSIGSLDPLGQTITDEQHEWDLDGNGRADETLNSIGCDETGGVALTCTYEEPGTYRVNLRLNPKGGVTQVASGIGILTIKVNPPKSRIHLSAQVGTISETLHEFDDRGRLTVNKQNFQITLAEAKNGIRYDASQSKDGSGDPNGLTHFHWSFGDGSNAVEGPNAKIIDNPKKTYTKTGSFPLQLKVRDKGGIEDRKFVNVIVTNIAARILTRTQRGDLNTTFEFDGGMSKSDLGSIVSYEWTILNEAGQELPDIQNNKSDTFRFRFETAGKYTVKLTVTDAAGESASASVQAFVESQTPKARFVIRGCVKPNEPCLDPNEPSLTEFDASASFDPDIGDTLSYRWEIVGANENIDFEVVEGALKDRPPQETKKIRVKFLRTGAFKVKLTVEDQHRDTDLRKSDSFEQDIVVSSIVELDWKDNMESAAQLNEEGQASLEIRAKVKHAEEFKIECGNGEKIEKDLPEGATEIIFREGTKTKIPVCVYDEAGSFTIKVVARSDTNGQNTIQKRIYIAAADTPVAVILLSKNNEQIFFEEDTPIEEIFRETRLHFDASQSMNVDGTNEGLSYEWDFGDGSRSTQKDTIHTFEDLSPADPGYFTVTLRVRDIREESEGKSAEAKVKIPVIAAEPQVQNLVTVKVSPGDTAPVDFRVTAEGATDPDGRIVEFTFWYFDEDDPERKLSVVTTPQNQATLTIQTKGDTGEEKRYSFCMSAKDNENNIAECDELFPDPARLPFATVINGPNQAPNANFAADRTNILVGQSVTFTSSSSDPDGTIASYVWDVMGDGFHNDTETQQSQITQIYDEKSPTGGYKVKLKVIDNKGASGFSREIPIFVDLPFNPPNANFNYAPAATGTRIQFLNASTVAPGSTATIVSYAWDFDTTREFCDGGVRCATSICQAKPTLCDRDTTNDPDATIADPIFEYPASGQYEVRLVVEDSNGQKDDVTKVISVVRGAATPEVEQILEAKITTDPPYTIENNKKVIHLSPPFGDVASVTFSFGDSLGNIHQYLLDKNIYFDTGRECVKIDPAASMCVILIPCKLQPSQPPPSPAEIEIEGDGCRDNDGDFFTKDGSVSSTEKYGRNFVTFHQLNDNPPGTRRFTARLTVFGTDEQGTQITDTDEVEIILEPPPFAAALIKRLGTKTAILGGLVAGAILAFIGYWLSIFFRRGKPRMEI